ncbi:hypothetical protein FHX06_005978 [Rhizobium sp. BK512]|uniref:hypothetical protein n=1 Tax=Rhizobium sp. BK512 TaxID=2587010 RepID=UPI0016231432|nr:hypothetical protein [Rhizobium sp. BK512]MBB3564614.1 hypothetical protein [Rhizobium sp. BK512]
MNNDKSPSNFKQTVVLVVAAFASVIGLMLFLGFGLLALVAWSDLFRSRLFGGTGPAM